MANIGAVYIAGALNYLLAGTTAQRATAWGLALSTGIPTFTSFSEIATGSGYTVQTMPMATVASPATVSTNAGGATFGPFSNACTVSGMALKDTNATAGNVIFYGTLATARTLGVGDSIVFAAGSLTITLS